MPNFIIYIRYIGTETSLNGYSINENNSIKSGGNLEKEYILLAQNIESLPKSIEIGLSNNMNKNNEEYYSIINFDIIK